VARLPSACEVKKLVGFVEAVLTFLPVARRFWTVRSVPLYSAARVDSAERRPRERYRS